MWPRLEQELSQGAGRTRVVTTPCPAQACAGTSRHVTEATRPQTDLRRSHKGTKLLLWTEQGAPKIYLADLTPRVPVWRREPLEVQ